MKKVLVFGVLVLFLAGCSVNYIEERRDEGISLGTLLHNYDLWYVDINATRGHGKIPFLQKAFTITFDHRVLRANNNLAGIGKDNGGYGVEIGSFFTRGNVLEVQHRTDGVYRFDVVQVDATTIDLYDLGSNLVYRLVGYQKHNFNYDMLFYDNIRYFLQEYGIWRKVYSSKEGALNPFDSENYLHFVMGDEGLFKSSKTAPDVSLSSVFWNFHGRYTISNIQGENNVKLLELDYGRDIERFELRVLSNDEKIELFHINSGTTYEFVGNDFIAIFRPKSNLEEQTRERFKDILPTVKHKIQKP
ncbi:nicotinic acid mononucleotide adenyltransferase [Capnocytophaga canimorsus]|uniref:nicotinic acid mononucleotide adenyltransferase n=1 Tax=Capnocytophaga canimorsus TaxID=28188 RepID=UPI0037D07416